MPEEWVDTLCRERTKCTFSYGSWGRNKSLNNGNNSTTNAFVIKAESILAEFVCREIEFYYCGKY